MNSMSKNYFSLLDRLRAYVVVQNMEAALAVLQPESSLDFLKDLVNSEEDSDGLSSPKETTGLQEQMSARIESSAELLYSQHFLQSLKTEIDAANLPPGGSRQQLSRWILKKLAQQSFSRMTDHLSAFDSQAFISRHVTQDVIGQNQIVIKASSREDAESSADLGSLATQAVRIFPRISEAVQKWLIAYEAQRAEAPEKNPNCRPIPENVRISLYFKLRGSKGEASYVLVHPSSTSLLQGPVDYFELAELVLAATSDEPQVVNGEIKFPSKQEAMAQVSKALLAGSFGIQSLHQLELEEVMIQFYLVTDALQKLADVRTQSDLPLQRTLKCLQPSGAWSREVFLAQMPLFSISRARVQYLSASIPLFKFRHSLFEALICSIHEFDIRPNMDERLELNDLLQKPVAHEKYLIMKFLEFMNHPKLRYLLELSLAGDSLAFVKAFNNLEEADSREYSQWKVQFYDINQRKFIIEDNRGREAFIVHYNGFVFGANYPKMLIIREREKEPEAKSSMLMSELAGSIEALEQELSILSSQHGSRRSSLESSDCDSEQGLSACPDNLIEKAPQGGKPSDEDHLMWVQDQLAAQYDSNRPAKNKEVKADDTTSEMSAIKLDHGFILRSKQTMWKRRSAGKNMATYWQQLRRDQMKEQERAAKNEEGEGAADHSIGTFGIRIEFETTQNGSEIPQRLVCHGFLPRTFDVTTLEFEGRDCCVKLILWLAQNMIDYKIDSRTDQYHLINLFTVGGQSREMPWLLRAMVAVAGRDAHFFGDLNNLKAMWLERIFFYDLLNYFGSTSRPISNLQELAATWKLNYWEQEGSSPKQEAIAVFDLARRFIRTLQGIEFDNIRMSKGSTLPNTAQKASTMELSSVSQMQTFVWVPGYGKTYNFNQGMTPTAGSLSLNIFQSIFMPSSLEIKGTSDAEIFKREKQSLLPAEFSIRNFKLAKALQKNFGEEEYCPEYRLYERQPFQVRASTLREHAVPIWFQHFNKQVGLSYSQATNKMKIQVPSGQRDSLVVSIFDEDRKVIQKQVELKKASLYRVKVLQYNNESALGEYWRLLGDLRKQAGVDGEESAPQEAAEGNLNAENKEIPVCPYGEKEPNTLTDLDVWGVELIDCLKAQFKAKEYAILKLEITEEVTYLQSRIFHRFLSDLAHKLYNSGKAMNPCKKHILEMIMASFSSKLSQKSFCLQQISHVNDFINFEGNEYEKAFEVMHPFYYAEFKPESKLSASCPTDIGSLARITAFGNACQRSSTFYDIAGMHHFNFQSKKYVPDPSKKSSDHIVFMDASTLLVRNSRLHHLRMTTKSLGLESSGPGPHQVEELQAQAAEVENSGYPRSADNLSLWKLRLTSGRTSDLKFEAKPIDEAEAYLRHSEKTGPYKNKEEMLTIIKGVASRPSNEVQTVDLPRFEGQSKDLFSATKQLLQSQLNKDRQVPKAVPVEHPVSLPREQDSQGEEEVVALLSNFCAYLDSYSGLPAGSKKPKSKLEDWTRAELKDMLSQFREGHLPFITGQISEQEFIARTCRSAKSGLPAQKEQPKPVPSEKRKVKKWLDGFKFKRLPKKRPGEAESGVDEAPTKLQKKQ